MAAAYLLGQQHNISELARLLGKSGNILSNKLNPDCDTHHLTLAEAVAITELADDDTILEAWAHSRGKALVSVPSGESTDEELADQVMLVNEVMGAVFQELRLARKDGVIDPQEHKTITSAVQSAVRELMNLEADVAASVRDLPGRRA
ncbi:phage regulatory CII family protein [Oceanisphaera sp. KMM 10153]|uniref:phage regulatory CII family protein n=1 Tax=Oceanisphaera submarina TaxID=3390193 RepID=UPI003975FA0F